MIQPELGKKIAVLRKAKGLTQEDLVEKCNINVRTLQRIESGEATPRANTLKLIFEALDYSFNNSAEKGLKPKWLEQFYISFIDLFNLKTNTMKKISILAILLSCIVFALFTIVLDGKAQTENDQIKTTSKTEILSDQSDSDIPKEYFSCEVSFQEKDELIGYGVKFNKNGVSANVQLLKLNTKTGEFNAGFVKGYFYSNKVEAYMPIAWIDRSPSSCSAKDSLVVDEKNKQMTLYGKAKLVSTKDEYIESNEIVLHYE